MFLGHTRDEDLGSGRSRTVRAIAGSNQSACSASPPHVHACTAYVTNCRYRFLNNQTTNITPGSAAPRRSVGIARGANIQSAYAGDPPSCAMNDIATDVTVVSSPPPSLHYLRSFEKSTLSARRGVHTPEVSRPHFENSRGSLRLAVDLRDLLTTKGVRRSSGGCGESKRIVACNRESQPTEVSMVRVSRRLLTHDLNELL
jgi:hypothetical protein